MTRKTSLNDLVEGLARRLGPWLVGTVDTAGQARYIYDTALRAMDPAENYWKGARLRVWLAGSGGWQERGVVAFSAASYGFEVWPDFPVAPPVGAEYQVLLPDDWEGLAWGVNRAIQSAAPNLFLYKTDDTIKITTGLRYNAPAGADDVIGIEVEAELSGEGYQPVPAAYYAVEHAASPSAWATAGDASLSWIVLQKPMQVGRKLRIHYKKYHPTLGSGTDETELDPEFVLTQAEAYLRRHILGGKPGALVQHHKELLVDAQAMADARRAEIAAGLAGAAPPPQKRRRR